jgi:hypothetical protein
LHSVAVVEDVKKSLIGKQQHLFLQVLVESAPIGIHALVEPTEDYIRDSFDEEIADLVALVVPIDDTHARMLLHLAITVQIEVFEWCFSKVSASKGIDGRFEALSILDFSGSFS